MSTFVGLANYKEMIGDKEVWRTFGNTLKYVIVTVPVGLALSTFLAALLKCKDQRKIHLPYPVFPSFGYHVCSCGHGLEMDLQ